jgi:hypothetical protein
MLSINFKMCEMKNSLIATSTPKIPVKGGSKKSPTPRVETFKQLRLFLLIAMTSLEKIILIVAINTRYRPFFYLNLVFSENPGSSMSFRSSYPQ